MAIYLIYKKCIHKSYARTLKTPCFTKINNKTAILIVSSVLFDLRRKVHMHFLRNIYCNHFSDFGRKVYMQESENKGSLNCTNLTKKNENTQLIRMCKTGGYFYRS